MSSSHTYEIRDPDLARIFLVQSLWLQRVMPPSAETVDPALSWALELISRGEPIPPLGFISDIGHVALGLDWEARGKRQDVALPNLPTTMLSRYEDFVLGKIYGDWSFSNASDEIRKYERPRDRSLGLAFLLRQLRSRSGYPGVDLSAGVITGARDTPAEELLAEGFESLTRDGLHEDLEPLYRSLTDAIRRMAEVLGQEDVEELRMRTALDPEGERLAMRQALEAMTLLEATLPHHRLRPLAGRQEVPTRVLDEDTYPVGGFSSLSNRGSVESLLHSQLAYIEDDDERPDLFDIKYLRDELLYYSRDENQFLRRRRTFVLALYPDLAGQIHFKDRILPYQRGILLLGALFVVMKKLLEWLSEDALTFDIVFIQPRSSAPLGRRDHPLKKELDLLTRRFREQITNSTVRIHMLADTQALEKHCSQRARRSLCHCLAVSAKARDVVAEDTVVTRMQITGPEPALGDDRTAPSPPQGDDALSCWGLALREILQRWI